MDFIIVHKHIFYNDIAIVDLIQKVDSVKENEIYLKYARKWHSDLKDLTDKELLEGKIEILVAPPKTYPKFDNEHGFKLKWDKGYVRNPKIISIKWEDGKWSYQLENIGHKTDYISEDRLEKL